MLLCSKSGFPQLILNIYDHLSQCTSIYIYIYHIVPICKYTNILFITYIYTHVYTYKCIDRKVDEMLLCSKSGFHHLILNIYIYLTTHPYVYINIYPYIFTIYINTNPQKISIYFNIENLYLHIFTFIER